jgi:hypothetical protein
MVNLSSKNNGLNVAFVTERLCGDCPTTKNCMKDIGLSYGSRNRSQSDNSAICRGIAHPNLKASFTTGFKERRMKTWITHSTNILSMTGRISIKMDAQLIL